MLDVHLSRNSRSQRLYTPRPDEWSRLKNTIQELQNSSNELSAVDKLDSLQAAAALSSSLTSSATVPASTSS